MNHNDTKGTTGRTRRGKGTKSCRSGLGLTHPLTHRRFVTIDAMKQCQATA